MASAIEPGIRVLLVDDHAMIRQGLRDILRGYPDVHVVGEAANGHAAIRGAHTLSPTVVVMDVRMPQLNGIEATAKIKQAYPHMTVVGLTMMPEWCRHAMIAAGAETVMAKFSMDQIYSLITAGRLSCSVTTNSVATRNHLHGLPGFPRGA